jgi:nondiscriminating glutamyl-tRNA synthetase
MPQTPRVRFAPSPTGYLHVGGARTAIFNWLFARHHKGEFLLRIEDTDEARSTRESEQSLFDDLHWLGLEWQEGPDKPGPHAPYRQSERQDIYHKAVDELVGRGLAYPCFCSDELLETKRKAAQARHEAPKYDGTCRSLGPDEVAAKRKEGHKEVVRFIVPEDEVVTFTDLVRGNVEINTNTVGDFVILRSTGLPTYNFAAAMDDATMEVTHVLRGEEHLPNTLRQILVYRALGKPVPEFAHLPLILAEDRSKLSKRHGASSVGQLRDMGFLPAAVVNYLVLLGWSHPDGKEVLDPGEMIESFTIERVNKSAAVYDPQKLRWMNGQHIRRMPVTELFKVADPHFPEEIRSGHSADERMQMLTILHDAIETLDDLTAAAQPFLKNPPYDDEAKALLSSSTSAKVLASLEKALTGAGDITPDGFKDVMKAVGKEAGAKGKDLYWPVRAALTGSVHGPDLAGVAAIKGRDTVVRQLREAQQIK